MDKKTTLVLKGIASFMILMYHLSVRNIFSSFGGYFGVGIFYFFSGYNLAYCTINRDDYTKKFWEKKFVRIFIPFYIMYVIYQVVLHKKFTVFILYHFVYPNFYCNYLWYVKCLIYLYIIYYIVYKIMRKINHVNYTVLGIVVWMVGGICMIPMNNDPNHIFPLAFIVGWMFAIHNEKLINVFKKNYYIMIFIVSMIALTLFLSFNKLNNITLYVFGQYFAPCFCGLLCYFIATSWKIHNKALVFLGVISYEIYMTHPVFLRLCEYNNIVMPMYIVVMLVGSYISAIILHWITYKVFDKYLKRLLKYK